MNNEDFVSYDLAMRLKQAGFDRSCSHYYTKENTTDDYVWITTSAFTSEDWNSGKNDEPDFLKPLCSAPTLAQAQKWLRERGMCERLPIAILRGHQRRMRLQSLSVFGLRGMGRPLRRIRKGLRIRALSRNRGCAETTYRSNIKKGATYTLPPGSRYKRLCRYPKAKCLTVLRVNGFAIFPNVASKNQFVKFAIHEF